MNKAERLAPPVYSSKITTEGVTLEFVSRNVTSKLDIRKSDSKKPSGHEGLHIGVTKEDGVDVNKASIVPSKTYGYAAYTEPMGFSAAGAAAGGRKGGQHDRRLIEAHGYEVAAAEKRSDQLLGENNNSRKVDAVTHELEARGTIDNVAINHTIRAVDEEAEELARKPRVIDVYVRTPDGNSQEVKGLRTEGSSSKLPTEVEAVIAQERKRQDAEKQAAIEAELQQMIREEQSELTAAAK